MYDNDKNVENFGLYEYTVTPEVTRRMLTPIRAVSANGGSVAVDNKLYTFQYDIQYGFVNSARYYVYDLTTGEQLSSTSMGYDLATAYSHAAVSSAVDPVSGTVYSSGYEYNAADDWAPVTAPLTAYKSKNVRLGLLGECTGGMRFIYVDNLTVKDKQSGVDSITGDNDIKITALDGTITVIAGQQLPIAVYTPDGRCIQSLTAQSAVFRLNAGIYIVKAGTRTAKVTL